MDRSQVFSLLQSGSTDDQYRALSWIAKQLPDAALAQPALALMGSNVTEIRGQVAEVLGKHGAALGEAAVEALRVLMRDVEENVRTDAVEAASVLKLPVLEPDLLRLVRQDSSTIVRATACEALISYPDSNALSALGEALKGDLEPTVRLWAAIALGDLVLPESRKLLEGSLTKETVPHVRATIGLALLKHGSIEGLEQVKGELWDLSLRDLHALLPNIRSLLESDCPEQLIPALTALLDALLGEIDLLKRIASDVRQAGRTGA